VSPTGAATATTSRCLIHSNQPANVVNIVFRWAPGWHPEAVDRRDIAVRQGLRFLRAQLPEVLGKRTEVLSDRMAHAIEDVAADWRRLEERRPIRRD
jgi:hypothetical protein